MLIRAEQIKALSRVPERVFENEMVAHLAEVSPLLFNVIKEDQMREAVRLGIARAGRSGLTLRGPIRLYLELMLSFGSHFENDPQYPWVHEALADDGSTPEMERAERLYQKTLDYQERVSGPDGAHTRNALNELLVRVRQPEALSSSQPADMLEEMARVFPQKAAYVGEPKLADLIEEGLAEARQHAFPAGRAEVLVVVLQFGFGHGCTDDPLYPWIARTLKDEKIVDPAARAERLEKKAVTWLEHVCAALAEGAQS